MKSYNYNNTAIFPSTHLRELVYHFDIKKKKTKT